MALQGCGLQSARVKIAQIQLTGMKDKAIIDTFVK